MEKIIREENNLNNYYGIHNYDASVKMKDTYVKTININKKMLSEVFQKTGTAATLIKKDNLHKQNLKDETKISLFKQPQFFQNTIIKSRGNWFYNNATKPTTKPKYLCNHESKKWYTLNSTVKVSDKTTHEMPKIDVNKNFVKKSKVYIASSTKKNLPFKYSPNKLNGKTRIFAKKNDEILLCLSIDGSMHSDYLLSLIGEEYLYFNAKMLCVYVYNSKIDYKLNYINKKINVIDKYTRNVKNYIDKTHFITEDIINDKHHIEQTLKLAENYDSKFVFIGYSGLKGPTGNNNYLEMGLGYLLLYTRIPIMLIKEKTLRNEKSCKLFNFLFILDNTLTNAYKIFDAFMPIINPEIDIIEVLEFGSTLNKENNWKDLVTKSAEKNKMNNFHYNKASRTKMGIKKDVIQVVNYGKINYDFVVFYNIPSKYKINSENMDIIKFCKANIGFMNNHYN
jgi:hypothetical protein